MSRILLIEPSKMMQHALVLALTPEHQLEIFHDPAGVTAATQGDLVIVDRAALRRLGAHGDAAGEDWGRPTICIDAAAARGSVSAESVALSMPFTREELKAAVARLLQAVASNRKVQASVVQDERRARKAKAAQAVREKDAFADKRVIDLVDVVDDEIEEDDRYTEASPRN